MQVLYITTMYPVPKCPQQGIFCHEQVKALLKLGIKVTVVVPVPFYSSMREHEWVFENVHIFYIRFFKLPGATDFHRTGKVFFKSLRKKIDLTRYDLYHADTPLPSGFAAMLAAQKYKKPFIIHGHGLDVFLSESYRKYKNRKKIESACERVYLNADAIVGVSKKVIDKIVNRLDTSTNKTYVVYNGVDTDKFYPIKREKNDCLVITSIGNLIPLKGHQYTLQAIKELVDNGYTNIKLMLVGRGELEENLRNLAQKLHIENYVEFLGYRPYRDIIKLLQNSDIFVLPSYYEGFGCVYLEAMACGIPAIGCRQNGIDEIIVDAYNGFLIDSKNVNQITDCIIKLMDEKARKYIGNNARKTVVDQYKWRNSAEELLKVYRKVCSAEEN